MEFTNINGLVERLLACPSMSSPAGRQSVVAELPANIQNSVMTATTASAKQQIVSIVRTCLNFPRGLEALAGVVKFYDEGTLAFEDLQRFLKENGVDLPASTSKTNTTPSNTGTGTSNTTPQPTTPPTILPAGKIKILFLSADPTNAGRLRLGNELSNIQAKILQAGLRDNFELLQPQMSVTTSNIQFELLEKKPQIVHFSGHGGDDGRLYFEDATGRAIPVSIMALGVLFKQLRNHVSCVVLNACYSADQAEAIAKNIKYVVGMSAPINDQAALAFAKGFYVGLLAGSVSEHNDVFVDAFVAGCTQILLDYEAEYKIPQLYRDGKLVLVEVE